MLSVIHSAPNTVHTTQCTQNRTPNAVHLMQCTQCIQCNALNAMLCNMTGTDESNFLQFARNVCKYNFTLQEIE